MGQSPMVTRLALEQPVSVQFEILLNQGLYFEYTQLLPGAVLIQLILGARGTPLVNSDSDVVRGHSFSMYARIKT